MGAHGERRGHQMVRRTLGAGAFVEGTQAEQFCGHCKSWITVTFVTGQLRFMSEHDSGSCTRREGASSPDGAEHEEDLP